MGEEIKFRPEEVLQQGDSDEQEEMGQPDVASLMAKVRQGGKGAKKAASALFRIDSALGRSVVYPATKQQRERKRRERKK